MRTAGARTRGHGTLCRVSFERALAQNPPPSGRVGDVSLRYDPPVLVGETARGPGRGRLAADVAMLGALGAGLAAVAALVSGSGTGWPAALAAVGGGLFLLSGALERRARGRRRFLLHFGTETLRLDLPGGLRGPTTQTVPFDAVTDLYVLVGADGVHALWVELTVREDHPPVARLLVDGVPEAESEGLRRLWTTLRAAFGLRPPAAPAGG